MHKLDFEMKVEVRVDWDGNPYLYLDTGSLPVFFGTIPRDAGLTVAEIPVAIKAEWKEGLKTPHWCP